MSNDTDFLTVRVLADLSAFVGVDGVTYNVETGDVVDLPALNAKGLIKRNVAVLLSNRTETPASVLAELSRIDRNIKSMLDQGPDTWGPSDMDSFISELLVCEQTQDEITDIMNDLGCRIWDTYPGDRKKYLSERFKEWGRKCRKPDAVTTAEINKDLRRGTLYSNVADEFLARWPAVVVDGSGELRLYAGGIYPPMLNRYETQTRILTLSDEFGLEFVPRDIENVEKILKLRCPSANPDEEAHGKDYEKLVVENGVLNVVTGQFEPHSPENVHFQKIPVSYDPGASTPTMFLTALSKSFQGEPAKISILQEIFGYCLYRAYSYRAIFFFLGDGRNGKAVILNLLESLLGSGNVSNIPPSELSNPRNDFTLMPVFGKLANIDGEAGKSKIRESAILKKLSGRDTISARNLRQSPIQFKNYAKLIFALNSLPPVDDFSEGFKSRIVILNFSRRISEDEQIPDLEKKIVDAGELPGILNWALEGLERLLKNDGFSYGLSSAERGNEYEKKSNPMNYFVAEMIDEEQGNWLPCPVLYQAYATFAKREGVPELTETEICTGFARECGNAGIQTQKKQRRVSKEIQKEFGITLKARERGFTNVCLASPDTDGSLTPKEDHDTDGRKAEMMKTLALYIQTIQRTSGGIEDVEDTAAGFLVKYPGYRDMVSVEQVAYQIEKKKEGYNLLN